MHNFFQKSQIYNLHVNINNFINLDFDLTISCSNNRVYAVRVKWYAIWGNSYQVINYISTSSIVNMTFPHTLSNAKNGFVSLTGFSYTGNFDFLLKVNKFL